MLQQLHEVQQEPHEQQAQPQQLQQEPQEQQPQQEPQEQQPQEQQEQQEQLSLAGVEDRLQLQCAGSASITSIRPLGRGAFAAVDLVSMPCFSGRKLLVRKRLRAATSSPAIASSTSASTAAAAATCLCPQGLPRPLPHPVALKSSSEADWAREAAMHRACAGSPFVVQLLAAKRCRSGDLLLLLEFASQGSLTDVLASLGGSSGSGSSSGSLPGGLPEGTARFYAGCVLLALEWLHSRRIMHRDVKPCNLLLMGDGYLKLGDLGCCCQLPPSEPGARTATGTASHRAPEVTAASAGGRSYRYPVDLFSLGLVIWQMADGALPHWRTSNQQQQQQQGEDEQQQQQQGEGKQQQQQQQQPPPCGFVPFLPAELEFPAHFSDELCELLRGLLCLEDSRLDAQGVRASSWFRGFDWAALADKRLPAPRLN